MLAQRRGRWASLSPALGRRVVFAGVLLNFISHPLACRSQQLISQRDSIAVDSQYH